MHRKTDQLILSSFYLWTFAYRAMVRNPAVCPNSAFIAGSLTFEIFAQILSATIIVRFTSENGRKMKIWLKLKASINFCVCLLVSTSSNCWTNVSSQAATSGDSSNDFAFSILTTWTPSSTSVACFFYKVKWIAHLINTPLLSTSFRSNTTISWKNVASS